MYVNVCKRMQMNQNECMFNVLCKCTYVHVCILNYVCKYMSMYVGMNVCM